MHHLPSRIQDVVSELRKELQHLYGERFQDLLLYGSYARGEADEGSDVDLLLLLGGPVDPVREILYMEKVTWPLSLASDLVLSVMPASLAAYRRGEDSFLRTVQREAVAA